jgi:hypothetical protein
LIYPARNATIYWENLERLFAPRAISGAERGGLLRGNVMRTVENQLLGNSLSSVVAQAASREGRANEERDVVLRMRGLSEADRAFLQLYYLSLWAESHRGSSGGGGDEEVYRFIYNLRTGEVKYVGGTGKLKIVY